MEFARLINLVLESFNEVDVSVTNTTHILSVICLQYDSAIELIVDGEVARRICHRLRGLKRLEIFFMIYSAKKFAVICHQNDSVTGKIEDLEAGGFIWSPL